MERTRILFLAANPDSTTPLHAGREVRRIRERLAGAAHRGSIEIVERWAVRPGDLQPALLEVRPHIVHFSGHGSDECELMLEGESGSPQPVGKRVLGELFRLRGDGVRLVVLSACHSLPQAEAIAEQVDCAIGMRRSIGSEAATELSAALYQAIASGDSVQRAFESARLHLEMLGIPEHRTPQLVVRRDGVDPSRIVFTDSVQPPGVVRPTAAAELEFASITLDRRETRWRLASGREETSPFSRPCRYYLQIEKRTADADLPFDVTILNLSSRPVTLSHIGIEVVELYPSYDWLTNDDIGLSDPRYIPAARKVEKQDAYVIEGHLISKLLRPRVMRALRHDNVRGVFAGKEANEIAGVKAPSTSHEAAIVAVGEAVWSQLDDPVYLQSGAPYRFGMIIRGVREHLPRNLILRLAARTQLGDSYSGPIETHVSGESE